MPTLLQAPPSPPDLSSAYGGRGGRGRPPWRLWVALVILATSATLVSLLTIRAIKWQPVASLVSMTWATIWFIVLHRRFYVSEEARTLRFLLWATVGGFVAEAIQVVVSGRTTIGVMWIVMGVIGIGGGFGIGSASIVIAWHSVVSLARLLLNWRAA